MPFVKNVISDEEIVALRAKHGDRVIVVETAAGDVALRPPTRDEFREFMKEVSTLHKSTKAEELVRLCAVAPSPEKLDEMIERMCGIVMTLSGPLVGTTGYEAKSEKVIPDPVHDETLVVVTDAGTLKFRRPKRAENQQYESEADDPKKKGDAVDRLVRDCLVDPSQNELKDMLRQYPATGIACIDPLRKFAGVDLSATVKK